MGQQRLVYFGHLPMEGAGSAIIVLRHLRRLKLAGWDITIMGDWGQDETICKSEGWEVRYLSHRGPWWPPYFPNHDFSARLRHWLWAGEVPALLGHCRPNAVLTYLSAFSDTLSQAAAAYARRFGLPLTTLVHDDCRAFLEDLRETARRWRRYRWVLRAATQNWFVSPELAMAYGFGDPAHANVLMPLCEGWDQPASQAPPPGSPLVVYAGNARDPQVPALERMAKQLERVGVELLVLAHKTPALAAALERSSLLWKEPFPSNREALGWLQRHATALLVAYADRSEAQPWVRSSFPSKLVELVHLGIPVLIAAPEDSAVAAWAHARGWTDWIRPDDEAALLNWVRRIQDPVQWRHAGNRALEAARTHFDPVQIQERFESRLLGRSGEIPTKICDHGWHGFHR